MEIIVAWVDTHTVVVSRVGERYWPGKEVGVQDVPWGRAALWLHFGSLEDLHKARVWAEKEQAKTGLFYRAYVTPAGEGDGLGWARAQVLRDAGHSVPDGVSHLTVDGDPKFEGAYLP